jgi:transcriptional regulator with XRE-family HTH domain
MLGLHAAQFSTLKAGDASSLKPLAGLISSMSLAKRIREAMGTTPQAEFARALKVTDAAVTLWLNGETKSLKATTAAKIEKQTGYSAQWIVTGEGPKRLKEPTAPPAPAIPNGGAFDAPTPEEMAFLNDFRALLDSDREHYRNEIGVKAQAMREHMEKLLDSLKGKGRVNGDD